jgi:hypothetical protein
MKTSRERVVEIIRESQQRGSPFLLWFAVEAVGMSVSLILAIPVGVVLGSTGERLYGEIGAAVGAFVPLLFGLSAWLAIKEKLGSQ